MKFHVTIGTKFQVSKKMNFFIPREELGVHANINRWSRVIAIFFKLFNDRVQETLVNVINEFADRKMQQNTSTTVH